MLILQIIAQYNVLTMAKILISSGELKFTQQFLTTPPLTKTQYIGIQRPALDLIKHLKTGKSISDNQTW